MYHDLLMNIAVVLGTHTRTWYRLEVMCLFLYW